MTRALSLTCLAWLMVGIAGSTAFAKPTIAVLGLEVVDPNGTPTAADTQVAKELSDGLRARAHLTSGPYALAPGGDKELIDQKLLNNCDTEEAKCMAAIGTQMGADFLMYGNIKRDKDKYKVFMNLLDVAHKTAKNTTVNIPVGESNGAAVQGWAKTIYGRLTGDTSAGATLVVKLTNADRGTILINNEPRGNITNGSGTVAGLEGKSYHVTVEAEGFRRYEKDVSMAANKTETVSVELEKGGEIIGPGSGPGPGPGPGAGGSGTGLWKGMLAGGVVVGLAGGAFWIYNWNQGGKLADEICGPTPMYDANHKCVSSAPDIDKKNEDLDRYTRNTGIGVGIVAVGAVVAGISIYKIVTSKGSSTGEHQGMRGHRVRTNRTFVVTPVISPNGGAATLRIDW